MKKITLFAIILATAFGAFAAAVELPKPQNEFVMSSYSTIAGWGKSGITITNVNATKGSQPITERYDVGTWFISNNVTYNNRIRIKMEPGVNFYIATNITVTFQGNDLLAGPNFYFWGPGSVAGTVKGLWGCATNWNRLTYPTQFSLPCEGFDNDSGKYLTTNTVFGGDVTGRYNEIEIVSNAVTTVEILNYTILQEDLSTNLFNLLTANPSNLPSTRSSNMFWARVASNSYTISSTRGWGDYTNLPLTVVNRNIGSNYVLTPSPHYECPTNGIYTFKTRVFFNMGPNWTNAGDVGVVALGISIDRPPYGNLGAAASAEDYYFVGDAQVIDVAAGILTTWGGNLFHDDYMETSNRVYPNVYWLGTQNIVATTNTFGGGFIDFTGYQVTAGDLP